MLVCAVTATSLTLGWLASAGLHSGAQALLSGGSATLTPKEFIQHGHDFAVSFPGTPEQTTVEGVFYDGSPLLTHYFDTRGPGSTETVSVTALPCEFEASAAADVISKRWEYEINAIAHDLGGSPVLVSGKEATSQSFPLKLAPSPSLTLQDNEPPAL